MAPCKCGSRSDPTVIPLAPGPGSGNGCYAGKAGKSANQVSPLPLNPFCYAIAKALMRDSMPRYSRKTTPLLLPKARLGTMRLYGGGAKGLRGAAQSVARKG